MTLRTWREQGIGGRTEWRSNISDQRAQTGWLSPTIKTQIALNLIIPNPLSHLEIVLRTGMAKFWKLVLVLALVIGVPWGGCQLFIRGYHLSFVPEAMGVSNLLYVSEQSWGFGPGGNETGFLAYEMPSSVAVALKERGLAYLEELPPNNYKGWQGVYKDWRETPVEMGSNWGPHPFPGQEHQSSPGIGDYLNKYGYSIPLELEWKTLADDALFAPGSYYAFGRIGLIILIPDQQRIIYAYNG